MDKPEFFIGAHALFYDNTSATKDIVDKSCTTRLNFNIIFVEIEHESKNNRNHPYRLPKRLFSF